MSTDLPTRDEWLASRPWIDQSNPDIDSYSRTQSETLFDLRQKLKEWYTDGVVIFEKAVDLTVLDQFERDIRWIAEHPKDFPIKVETEAMRPIEEFTTSELLGTSGLKFHGLHAYSSAARALCLTPHVTRFLWHIFGDRPAAMSTLTFLRGSQQMAHADFPFVFQQMSLPYLAASWIPLEDIHPDSGPLAYYPGTHRVEDFGFYDFGNGQIILRDGSAVSVVDFGKWLYQRIEEEKIPRKIFLPRRGDALIWHGALVHEGLAIRNQELTRKSLVTHYTTVRHMPDSLIVRDKKGNPLIFKKGVGVVFQYPGVHHSQQVPTRKLSPFKNLEKWLRRLRG